jgi:tRNA pseudouridine55 synthase
MDAPILQAPLLRIYHLQHSTEQFMGLVEQKNGVLHPKRLLATDRLEHVLEQPLLPPYFSIDTSIKHHSHSSHF